jgi:serine/threonine protein kinase
MPKRKATLRVRRAGAAAIIVPKTLVGVRGRYQIVRPLGGGAAGLTFEVRMLPSGGRRGRAGHGVVKMPRHVERADASLPREYSSLRRLDGLDCVAPVVDHGSVEVAVDGDGEHPTQFIVQRFVDGHDLPDFLKARYGRRDGSRRVFAGLPTADEFFHWAWPLAVGLNRIHQQQVIHGDIWPENIRVRRSDRAPVYIDFGQAVLRGKLSPQRAQSRNFAYIAPEPSSVASDVYSLGGVLYYLATGDEPFEAMGDIDDLKTRVVNDLIKKNERLYTQNLGIADIISRCLRRNIHDRVPNAAALIDDLETFRRAGSSPSGKTTKGVSTKGLRAGALKRRGEARNPFFQWIGDLRAQALVAELNDMNHGVCDLNGDHEAIVGALTKYVSVLGKGDQYLTVSTPAYWRPQNLGLNGRFLSMNKMAAQNGATIRRVFLVTADDLAHDDYLQRVLRFHMKEMTEGGPARVPPGPAIELGGYYTCVKVVTADERAAMIRDGQHFGLIIQRKSRILMFPTYRDDDTLVTIRFRTDKVMAQSAESAFRKILATAQPLSSFAF